MTISRVMRRRVALNLAVSLSGVLAPVAVGAGTGGPDVFGYRWTSSLAPEPTSTFGWVDLSRTGIDSGLHSDDAAFGPIPLGFVFPFYGRYVAEVAFSTNGLVTFGEATAPWSNGAIPSPDPPNQLIAVFFDDLVVPPDGAVLFQAFRAGEIAPAEKGAAFVVEWLDVSFYGADGRATFEVIVFADGEIKVQYLGITGPIDSATVGIEDADGLDGLQYRFNGTGEPISDGVAVVFSPPPGMNRPPTIDRFTATPSTGDAPLTVAFEVAATDRDGTIVEVRWDFDGDGVVDQAGTAFSASFTYTRGGTFTPMVTVIDEAEAPASSSTTITVSSSVTFTLTIEVLGEGAVRSTPQGIDCGTECSAEFAEGSVVSLHPSPAQGSAFTGWGGDPDCADGSVLMYASKACTATFDHRAPLPLTVALAGSGRGRVTSNPAGIDCGERCAADFAYGTLVTLVAHPEPGSIFIGWAGDSDCFDSTITMDRRMACTAFFDPAPLWPLTVWVAGFGHGSIRSTPPGIDCGLDCTEDYAQDTVVTLVPLADPGSVFVDWFGDADCHDGVVTMDFFKSCGAAFDLTATLTVALSGQGRGTVTSSPPGIDCGADCSEEYSRGTVVTLHARPADDSLFVRWQGDCASGTVMVYQASFCTAVFALRPVSLTVRLAGNGFGSVVSNPRVIRCVKGPLGTFGKCSEEFENRTVIHLAVEPALGSAFAGWSGDPDCADGTVTLDTSKECTASFDLRVAVLYVVLNAQDRAGHGTVTVVPGGLTCVVGELCVAEFEPGTTVTLTANPAPGSVFARFELGCVGTAPSCTVRVDAIVSVSARFEFFRVGSVTVTPTDPVLIEGEQVRFTATAGTEDGAVVPLDAGLALWSTSDPSVASVAPDGSVTALSRGVTTVTARAAVHRPIAITAGGGPTQPLGPGLPPEVSAHTCALLSDGSVECWGDNHFGQLGSIHAPVPSSSFGPVRAAGIAQAAGVAAGGYHTCAVLSDGTARCWGANHVGQLGTGTFAGSTLPVPVQGLAAAVSVEAALFHTCALLADGGVQCWGSGFAGQLGELAGIGSSVPVPVPGVTGARGLATGLGHTCAALEDGRVLCWGLNHVGQLGNGTTTTSPVPTPVDGITTAAAITAGEYHTCALLEAGTVRCWGANAGRLGNGEPEGPSSCTVSGAEVACSPLPVDVVGIDSATTLSAGNAHTCAVLSDGAMRCWGSNNTGQLGDGTADAAPEAVAVEGIIGATAVAGGHFHTCALLVDGTARCWGLNHATQLGTDSIPDSGSAPVDVRGISSATAVSAGDRRTCARLSDGTMRCWGLGIFGELGTAGVKVSPVPVMVEGLTDAATVAAGSGHACALLGDGRVRCWGLNTLGQLGQGSIFDASAMPLAVPGLTGAIAVGVGQGHSCAVLSDGRVQCWGHGDSGQLGAGELPSCRSGVLTFPCSTSPVAVAGITTAVAIAAGGSHTCALLADETVRCWGSNGLGQLGDGTTVTASTPVLVRGIAGAAAVTAGDGFTCALLSDGSLRCWGGNFSGQLGSGTSSGPETCSPGPTPCSRTPVMVEGVAMATAVSAGGRHACAVLADRSIRCWGSNLAGELGDGTRNSSPYPVAVRGVTDATSVAAGKSLVGHSHTCALLSNGRLRCWGVNTAGTLGNGVTGGFSADPVPVVRIVPQASGSTTLTVLRRNRPPVADAGPDRVAECASPGGAAVTLDGSRSSDPDGDALGFEWTGAFGSVPAVSATVTLPLGASWVVLTVTDGRATDVAAAVIDIRDTTAPAVTAPPPVVVEATGPSGQPVTIGTTTAVDACDAAPRTTSNAPALFLLGTTTVTWTATDASGNSATAAQAVTVRDTTPPTLTVPGRIVTDAVGPGGAPVTYSASATDVADLQPAVTCVPPSGSTFAIGTTHTTCMATDGAGNASSAAFEVHVKAADEQLADLISLVIDVARAAGLAIGLNAKLRQASAALAAALERPAACNLLDAFVHQVEGLSSNALAVDVAHRLSASARRIQAVLACP